MKGFISSFKAGWKEAQEKSNKATVIDLRHRVLPSPPPTTQDGAEPSVTLADILAQGWLAPCIAAQLPAKDALAFAAVCRDCRVVRLAPPLKLKETKQTWHNPSSRYSAHEWQDLPLDANTRRRAHSVLLKCRWQDQGWGNRKGMLSVVAEGGTAPNDYTRWSEKVLAGAEPAPHDQQPLALSFRAPEGAELPPCKLFARAGGGGGHSLTVSQLCVRALVFE